MPRLLICLLVLVLLFSACDNDDDDDNGSGNLSGDDDDNVADDDSGDDDDEGLSVSPNEGGNFLPTPITIHGSGFVAPLLSASLGGTVLEEAELVSSTEITALVPSGLPTGALALELKFAAKTLSLADAFAVNDDYSGFVIVTGTLSDPWGAALENLKIYADGSPQQAVTQADGGFAIAVPEGNGDLLADNVSPDGNYDAPWGEATLLIEHEFVQDESLDLVLDFAWLSGTVTGPDKANLQNVAVQVTNIMTYIYFADALTDYYGEWEVPLYPGTYSVLANPSNELELAPGYEPEVVFTGSETVPMELMRGNQLRGEITDREGEALVSMNVVPHMESDKTVAMAWTQTDVDGEYVTYVPSGTFIMNLTDPPRLNPQLPEFPTWAAETIEVDSDTTWDYQFEYMDVAFAIQSGGNPLDEHLTVVVEQYGKPWLGGTFETDDGMGQMRLFAGNYDIAVYPPQGSGLAPKLVLQEPVDSDRLITITLDEAVQLSGQVVDQNDEPLEGFSVCATPNAEDENSQTLVGGCDIVDENGIYAIDLAPGRYDLEVTNNGSLPLKVASGAFLQVMDIPVADDTTYNMAVDIWSIAGVIRRDGEPVEGWRIMVESSLGKVIDAVAEEGGAFSLSLPTGTYDFTFFGPSLPETRPTAVRELQIEDSAEVVVDVPES